MSNNKKSIIAVVLAGGQAEEFRINDTSLPKALIPVCGRPVADYVIASLELAEVERIFVVGDKNSSLRTSLKLSSKCTLIEKQRHDVSFGESIIYAVTTAVESMGESALSTRMLMVVSCDTPLVTAESYNSLIRIAAYSDADGLFTIIPIDLLRSRFPARHFKGGYLRDRNKFYTSQNVTFVNCSFFSITPPSTRHPRGAVSFGTWKQESVERLISTMDSLRQRRKRIYLIPYFIFEFALRRLAARVKISSIISLVVKVVLRRLTMTDIIGFVNDALQLKAGYIESDRPEISADIDTAEDLMAFMKDAARAPACESRGVQPAQQTQPSCQ